MGSYLEATILVVHILLSIALIGLVLIQQGKGADAGAAFGAGASGTVFGAGGAASFLTKLTTWIAIAFFAASFTLAYFASQTAAERSLIDLDSPADTVIEADAVIDTDAVVDEAIQDGIDGPASDTSVLDSSALDAPALDTPAVDSTETAPALDGSAQ